MRLRTAALLLAAAGAAALAAGGCGDDSGGDDPAIDRRIELIVGDLLPLSGPRAAAGAGAEKAAQLAVEQINDAIGEAGVDHTLEIVHRDGAAGRSAVSRLIEAGAGCLIGPWRIGALRRAARPAGDAHADTLLIEPRSPFPAPRRAVALISLPLTDPDRVLATEASGGDDPSVAFAQLYATTDPTLGDARASDARQFDAVILCYLAAVAAGSESAARMAASVGDAPPGRRGIAWPQLADAVERLQRGIPVVYRGVTLRVRLTP